MRVYTGKKIVFRTLGFNLSTLGSVPSNVFKVPKTTVNTFDGTDPKVDRLKPKVRNTIFFPVISGTQSAIIFMAFRSVVTCPGHCSLALYLPNARPTPRTGRFCGDLIREEYLKHNNFATYKWR